MPVGGSIVLWTHHRASHLRTALESLSSVDRTNVGSWELIVVDHNSTDDTREVVKVFRSNLFANALTEVAIVEERCLFNKVSPSLAHS